MTSQDQTRIYMTWDDVLRLFTCHRCRKAFMRDDDVMVGMVKYHQRCIPPNIFHKLCPDGTALTSSSLGSEPSTESKAVRSLPA